MSSTINVDLQFFAVRSKDGKWFRMKGYGGGGNSWVDDIKKARVYGKIGPARAVVTWWSKRYPEYGVPEIIVLNVTNGEILNEEKRVKDSIRKKQIEEANYEIRKRNAEIERLEKEIDRKRKSLKELKSK